MHFQWFVDWTITENKILNCTSIPHHLKWTTPSFLPNLVHITGLWCKSIMQTYPITCITSFLRTLKVSLSPWHPLSSVDVNYTLMKRFPWRRPTSRQTAVTRLLWQEEPQMLSAFRKVKTMFNVSLGGGHCLWDKTAVCSCKKERTEKAALREICWKMQRIIWPFETRCW